MAMDVGDAKLTIRAEDNTKRAFDKINKSSKNMSANFKKAGLAMAAVGAAMVLALGKMVTSYAKAGDEIAKMRKRTGIATETLSKWRYMAELSGTSITSMEKGYKKLAMSISDARDGLMTYTREFEKIGVDVRELEGLSPEDQFMRIAFAVAEIKDPMQRAASAQKLFGRAGMELLPMLSDGAEGMRLLTERAEKFAVIYDEEAAESAEIFNDALLDLKGSLGKMSGAIAETVMPQITEFVELITEKVQPAIAWLKDNPEVVEAFIKFGLAIGAGGVVFLAVGQFVKALSALRAMLLAINWQLVAIVGALIYVALGFKAISRGKWPTFKNILAEARLVGLEIAKLAGALMGMKEGVAPGEGVPPSLVPSIPSEQFGGIVPGALGQPVPIIAHGGEQFAGVGKSFGGNTFQFYIGNFMGDEASQRELVGKFKEIMGQDSRRTSFSGINRLGYYPGSSAP